MILNRRQFAQLSGTAAGAFAFRATGLGLAPADFTIEIAPFTVELSPKHRIPTVAYNGQVPGPLFRMKQGRPITVEIRNRTAEPDIVHWHGLFLPSEIDGAMEEGTPMLAPGEVKRYTFTPDPAGFRWFHTHTFAGKDRRKAQYGGEHGFLLIEPRENPARYDREIFLALHDWEGRGLASGDGSMMPVYEVSTINGKMLGFGEPLRVKQGERIMLHVLNSSPTGVHWVSLSGHKFQVVALDGNPVPRPQTVEMLCIAPAERVSVLVEMNSPGVWVLGEVRQHIQAAGMGIVLEYANATGKPKWVQPPDLIWNYQQFAAPAPEPVSPAATPPEPIELVFDSKFEGHGREEIWRINGKTYPHTDEPVLRNGRRYRLIMKNHSIDDHPIHLHRHTFEVRRDSDSPELFGLQKDVVLAPANSTTEIEFTANNPGRTLFHCHQQDHMDRGFMMVFRYA